MRFLGSDVQFKNLKDSQENLIDSLLMNSFNEGFNACNTSITELYNQAVAAIDQDLVGTVGQDNPFLTIIKHYNEMQASMMVKEKDTSGVLIKD